MKDLFKILLASFLLFSCTEDKSKTADPPESDKILNQSNSDEKLNQSDKHMIIYKVNDGYNIYTDFSKKIILNKNKKKNKNNFKYKIPSI